MLYLIIKNYKKRLVAFCAALTAWSLLLALCGYHIAKPQYACVSMKNCFNLLYPQSIEITHIYNDEKNTEPSVSVFRPLQGVLVQESNLPQSYINFKSEKYKLEFKYPSFFNLSPKEFSGGEILYHIDFQSKIGPSRGFIEVWNMPYSLERFLNNSKATSQQSYKYFSSNPENINGLPGYMWDYSVLGNNNKYYKGMEGFFKKGTRMHRLSYFVPESLWNEKERLIFRNMLQSYKVY